MKPFYPELASVMARNGHGAKDIAELLSLSIPVVNNRLMGRTDWKLTEVRLLCAKYRMDYYTLFKRGE